MTQFQFDSILKIIELGAPALYEDLGGALKNLVGEASRVFEENEKLKVQLKELQNTEDDKGDRPENTSKTKGTVDKD